MGSALAIGVFSYFLGRGQAGSTYSTLLGARVVSFGLLVAAVAVARVPMGVRPARLGLLLVAVDLADLGANALFALAAHRGLLAIVAVLGTAAVSVG